MKSTSGLWASRVYRESTLLTAAFGLIVAALVASHIPARRAASVNPIEVLRAE